MSLYLEQIRQLVALQRVDDAIHSVEMELEQAPKELEDLKNRFAATNTQRERVLEKLAHLKGTGKAHHRQNLMTTAAASRRARTR